MEILIGHSYWVNRQGQWHRVRVVRWGPGDNPTEVYVKGRTFEGWVNLSELSA